MHLQFNVVGGKVTGSGTYLSEHKHLDTAANEYYNVFGAFGVWNNEYFFRSICIWNMC